jgi:hypothetical protein
LTTFWRQHDEPPGGRRATVPIHILTGYDEDVVAAFQLEREPGLIAVFLLALLP